jgi:hypothetical protein
MRIHSRVIYFLLLACLNYASPVSAQTQLPDIIGNALRSGLGGVAVVAADGKIADGRTLKILSQNIDIPDWLNRSDQFIGTLSEFDTVPDKAGRVSAGSTRLRQILLGAAGLVEFSKTQVSENANIGAAYKILYADDAHQTPSRTYKDYLSRKEEYDAQNAILKNTTDPAKRGLAISKLQKLNTDWALFGHKSEVEAALAIVVSSQDASSSGSYSSWKASIADGSSIDPSSIALALGRSDWIRISVSPDTLRSASLTLRASGNTVPVPFPSTITLQFLALPIRRPALEQQFLSDDTWRLKNGLVLSDGDPSSDNQNELLPRYVGTLILVKNLEIAFSDDLSSDALAVLSQAGEVELSGWHFTTSTGSHFQIRFVSITPASIAGYIVENLPKIPNPSGNRSWQ